MENLVFLGMCQKCFGAWKLFYCCKEVSTYMNTWMTEKFNETLLLEKEGFYSHLSIADVTDADDTQANRICKY